MHEIVEDFNEAEEELFFTKILPGMIKLCLAGPEVRIQEAYPRYIFALRIIFFTPPPIPPNWVFLQGYAACLNFGFKIKLSKVDHFILGMVDHFKLRKVDHFKLSTPDHFNLSKDDHLVLGTVDH